MLLTNISYITTIEEIRQLLVLKLKEPPDKGSSSEDKEHEDNFPEENRVRNLISDSEDDLDELNFNNIIDINDFNNLDDVDDI